MPHDQSTVAKKVIVKFEYLNFLADFQQTKIWRLIQISAAAWGLYDIQTLKIKLHFEDFCILYNPYTWKTY